MGRTVRIVAAVTVLLVWGSPAMWAQASDSGIVLARGLRVRSHPGLSGEVIGRLDWGDVVAILQRTVQNEQVGEMTDYWYRVKTDHTEGWTFGGYLSRKSLSFPPINTSVYYGSNPDDPLESVYHLFTPKGDRTFTLYEQLVRFSPDGRYYLTLSRQDIIGYLEIRDTISGETLAKDHYSGPDPQWNGDALTYKAVVPGGTAVEDMELEAAIFDDGYVTYPERDMPAAEPAPYREELWERWTLYESPDSTERLSHVRVEDGGDVRSADMTLVFMGVAKTPSGAYVTRIYELIGNQPYVVDSFPAAVETPPGTYGIAMEDESDRAEFYLRRQPDNLVLHDGSLSYYRELSEPPHARQYLRYRLGSRTRPQEISVEQFRQVSDRVSFDGFEQAVASPDGKKVAFSNTYDIFLYHSPGAFEAIRDKSSNGYKIDPEPGDSNLTKWLNGEPRSGQSGDPALLIGSLSWSRDGRFIYFDNSGIDYRCIWEWDLGKHKVKKVVPEHEAIDPWYFELAGHRLVAYVERNTIRIAGEGTPTFPR